MLFHYILSDILSVLCLANVLVLCTMVDTDEASRTNTTSVVGDGLADVATLA